MVDKWLKKKGRTRTHTHRHHKKSCTSEDMTETFLHDFLLKQMFNMLAKYISSAKFLTSLYPGHVNMAKTASQLLFKSHELLEHL